jgi:hypothetical protein
LPQRWNQNNPVGFHDARYNFIRVRREALMMTDTELNAIAALAITGLKSSPKKG